MQKRKIVIALVSILVSGVAAARIWTEGGSVKCTNEKNVPCKWKLGAGEVWLCQGPICLKIVQSQSKTDPK